MIIRFFTGRARAWNEYGTVYASKHVIAIEVDGKTKHVLTISGDAGAGNPFVYGEPALPQIPEGLTEEEWGPPLPDGVTVKEIDIAEFLHQASEARRKAVAIRAIELVWVYRNFHDQWQLSGEEELDYWAGHHWKVVEGRP